LVVAREGDAPTWEAISRATRGDRPVEGVAVAEPGVVAALNAGLAVARADVVAFTDDDAAPGPDWLARIERHFERDPRLGGVGGRDWIREEPAGDRGASVVGRVRWYGRTIGNHHLGAGEPREVDILKGANMSFRLAAIPGVGLDERLRGSGAQPHYEMALSLAVKRGGWKLVYDPSVAIDHYPAERLAGDARWSESDEALFDAVHNQTYALLRWLPWWRKPAVLAYGLLVGTRQAPALVTAIERLIRDRDRRAVLGRFAIAMRARMEAIATALSAARSS
jgi:cellulose synthase/poly-beta-1,6-N-acetylglucosamine synthase-like glycosyltransferase